MSSIQLISPSKFCSSHDPLFFSALLGLFAAVSLIGTLFDLFLRKVQDDTANATLPPVGIIPQAFLCFSIYSSWMKLMDCSTPAPKDYMR